MAIERAGISLVAENAQSYLSTLKVISAAQKEAFNPNIVKDYNDAIKRANDSFKNLPKNVPMPKLPPPDDAKRLQAALDLLGKTGSYNISKISEEALRLKDALDTVRKSGQFDIKPNIIKSDRLGELTASLDKSLSNNPFKAIIGDVNQLTGAVGGLLAKFTLVAGILKVVSDLVAFGQASVAVAQRNETLAVSLQTVAEHVGYNNEQIKLAVGLLNKQGITTQAAQQSLMRMARANISWAEASKLAAIAQGSAVVAGMNSSDAFNRLVTGIQKMEPELLDELGITLRRTEAYEKFAVTVGKNAKQLTDAEKQQAILNEIYAQSEAVLGVYDAAMETSGKRQASLARLVEETQNNFGKLLLPLQEASISMQTDFWKGAQVVTKAMQSWIPLMSSAIPSAGKDLVASLKEMGAAMLGLSEGQSFTDRLSEGIYNFGRIAVASLVATRTAGKLVVDEFMQGWHKFFEMMEKGFSGDFAGALQIYRDRLADTSFMDKFQQQFNANMLAVLEEYPDLMKSWDEVNKEVEGSSEDLRLATDDLTSSVEDQAAATEKLIDTLEATKDAYKKAKNIQENFQKAQTNAKEEYEKGLADAEKKYLAERERKIAEFNKKLAEFDQENARKRAKMIDEFNFNQATRLKEFNLQRAQAEQSYDLKVKQDKRKFYDDQKKALRDFQLSQAQAQRQQQVTDRRLRSDGDVLALMDAREDFALQQQENTENFTNQQTAAKEAYEEQKKTAAENFALQEEQARQSFALQTEIQREEFQRRLAEFDENIAIQREKMLEAHAQELIDLDAKYEEEKTKLAEQYQEKLALAQEQRDEQLKALGDSLKEEGKITEEGMKEIADKISEVFGDQQAGDQLIKGWSERSKDEINNVVDEITAKINELKATMDSATTNASSTTSTSSSSSGGGGSGSGGYNDKYKSGETPKPIGARHGFNGVVTGPKTFQVEPGVREHVQITPMQRMGGSLKLSGSAQVQVNGMPDGASADLEERISGMIVENFKFAIKKLSRRGN